MEKVIDISNHNGSIDFREVKSNGINKVIIRIGWIGNKNNHTLDERFIENYNRAIEAGMNIGIYVYSYCKSVEAVISGTNWVLEKLKLFSAHRPNLPIFIDIEDVQISLCSKENLTAQAKKFNEMITEAGFISGTYANLNWFRNKLNVEELTQYKIWLAQYNNEMTAEFKVDLWQYTSNGRIAGINGRVDMSNCLNCENIDTGDITGDDTNQNNGGDFEVKEYHNGSTKEIVYQDLYCKKKIGYLNPWENCECYGIIDGMALVVYNIDGSSNKKTGFVKWLGGVR